MKNMKIKAILYSLLLSILFTLSVVTLYRGAPTFTSYLIPFILSFMCMMVIMWDNKTILYYIWRFSWPDWVKTADIWFCVLLGTVLYLSVRYVWFMYVEGDSFSLMGCIMALLASFAYRDVYLCHAPSDIEEYERNLEQNEYMNTFVTVAECKDVDSAHIIKELLESNGIEVTTFGESAPKYIGSVPVRVLVRRKDKEAAERIISE